MSRKDMLGGLVERLVKVSDEMLRMLDDLLTKTLNPEWFSEFKKFLRKETCWTVTTEVEATVEMVEQIKIYLRRLFTFKLGETNGKDVYATARKVFRDYFDPHFENWGVVFSGVAPETEVVADEIIQNGKFPDFLGNTATELEKRRLLGSQFLTICRGNPENLREDGYANFFILTEGDKVVAENLSNVFVASVHVHAGGGFDACLSEFQYDRIWFRNGGHRIFSPKQ